jgi:membrane-associated protease RseP (regulator of RpoE activity)
MTTRHAPAGVGRRVLRRFGRGEVVQVSRSPSSLQSARRHGMRRVACGLVVLALVVAVPLVAGDEQRCKATAQDCLNYMKSHMADRGWIGIEYDEEDQKVLRVIEGSPAEKAGFRKGDVMVAIYGVDMTDENSAKIKKIQYEQMKPGNQVTYTVTRAGMKKNLVVTLAAVPDDIMAQWVGRHMLEAHAEEIQLASKN